MANKKCPVAKKCSGCQLSNMTYEQQLEWKQKDTEKLLGGFGKVSKIIGADEPYNYRNKVQAVFRSDRNGRIISGVYQSSRNGIVGIDSCMLDDKRADEIIVGIRELLRSFKFILMTRVRSVAFYVMCLSVSEKIRERYWLLLSAETQCSLKSTILLKHL